MSSLISVVAAQAKVGLVRTTSAGNKTAKLEVSNHTALPINYASSKARKRCRCWLSLCRIAETKLGRPNLAKKKRNNGVGANDQSRDPGSLVISHPLIAHDVTAPRSKSSEDGGEIRISILTFEPPPSLGASIRRQTVTMPSEEPPKASQSIFSRLNGWGSTFPP